MTALRLLVLALLFVFCSLAGYLSYQFFFQRGGETLDAQIPSAPEEKVETVTELPDFRLAELGGTHRSIRDWLGRPLVINFWATWCPPCLREIPLLEAFQTDSEPWGAQVIGIAVDRTPAVQSFAEKDPFNYPILVGQSDGMAAASAFGIDFLALPFTAFITAKGEVLAVHTGEITQGDLDNFAEVIQALTTGTMDLATGRARLAGRE